MTLSNQVRDALAITPTSSGAARTIDITMTGAKSGERRRIETWFYRAFDTVYLSGRPGKRGWYANLLANPEFTFHIAGEDVPARATPITDPAERRRILPHLVFGTYDLDEWIDSSPLMEITFD